MPTRLLLDPGGRVLVAEQPDLRRNPASLAKMMTLYLLFEAGISLDTMVTVADAGKPGRIASVRLGLVDGESVSLRDLTMGMVVWSANDAARAAASHLADSPNAFVARMNDRAREMGLARTTFATPSGVFGPGQTTTGRDMATLARRLYMDFPQHRALFGYRSFTFRGVTRRASNRLLGRVPGVTGLKTGTNANGFCHLAVSTVSDHIAVVMGYPDRDARDADMEVLLREIRASGGLPRRRGAAGKRLEIDRGQGGNAAPITTPEGM